MSVGEVLKRFRKQYGVAQQQVSDSIKVLKPSYKHYEYGKNIHSAKYQEE